MLWCVCYKLQRFWNCESIVTSNNRYFYLYINFFLAKIQLWSRNIGRLALAETGGSRSSQQGIYTRGITWPPLGLEWHGMAQLPENHLTGMNILCPNFREKNRRTINIGEGSPIKSFNNFFKIIFFIGLYWALVPAASVRSLLLYTVWWCWISVLNMVVPTKYTFLVAKFSDLW